MSRSNAANQAALLAAVGGMATRRKRRRFKPRLDPQTDAPAAPSKIKTFAELLAKHKIAYLAKTPSDDGAVERAFGATKA